MPWAPITHSHATITHSSTGGPTLRMVVKGVLILLLGLLWAGAGWATGANRDMRFEHYTFALIWQPGACLVHAKLAGPDCAQRTLVTVSSRQWSLHGLWPSIPGELSRQGIAPPTWWHYGCYFFHLQHTIPAARSCQNPALDLQPEVRTRLAQAMPAARSCLDRHEYYKHAACYGFKQNSFFRRALNLLRGVNANPFTEFMRGHRGRVVNRAALQQAFRKGFGLSSSKALELRCAARPGIAGKDVLVQAWITLRADRIEQFPAPRSFMPGRRGNCAAQILIAR